MRKLFAALAVLSVLAAPALAQVGGGDEPNTPSVPPAVSEQLGNDLAQAQKEIASAVPTGPSADVLIEAAAPQKNGKVAVMTGSGVYVGKGLVITDLHVVEGAKKIRITLDRNGVAAEKFNATVVKTEAKNDLALLHVETNLPEGMKSAEPACRAPVIGEPIEIVGNPLGVQFVHTWGRVGGVARVMDGKMLTPIDATIASGNSGGPVYDKDGKVLGLSELVITPGDHAVGFVNMMTPLFVICKDGAPA